MSVEASDLRRPRPQSARSAPAPRDLVVFGLPAAQACRLRDALARAGVSIDADSDEDAARVAARDNPALGPRQLLSLVANWASSASFVRIPISYGDRSYVLELRGTGDGTRPTPELGAGQNSQT